MGKSFEKKMEPKWSEKIIDNTKHWTRPETSQFLELLINLFGEQGAVYQLSHNNIYKIFSVSNPNEIKKVIDFIDDYTKKYGVITDTLENRVNYFRQFVSLPRKQQNSSKIQISNFSELKEFSDSISKKLRELDTEIEEKSSEELRRDASIFVNRLNLQLIQSNQVGSLFSSFSKTNVKNLKETVAILEQYIRPEEIAKMMMDKHTQSIYLTNPQNLREVINILKTAHSVPLQENINEHKERMLKKIETATKKGTIEPGVAKPITTIIEQMTEPPLKPEELISYMIREYNTSLLSANPEHVRDTMAILEKSYISKGNWRLILQPRQQKEIQRNPIFTDPTSQTGRHSEIQHGILLANPIYLQKVLNVFEKYLERDHIIYLIIHKFEDISMIRDKEILDYFIKTVEILGTHIDIKDTLEQRISELLEDSVFSVEIYNALTEMSSTSDRNIMKKSLTELPLSEFSLSIQEAENSMTEKPPDPTTLH